MFIYKITNLLNKKVYIGQTIYNIESRFRIHINAAYNRNLKHYDTVFYKAIRKYGAENFSVEYLDNSLNSTTPLKTLNELEIHYIKEYNSYIGFEDSNGYNSTLGGGGKLLITTMIDIYIHWTKLYWKKIFLS